MRPGILIVLLLSPTSLACQTITPELWNLTKLSAAPAMVEPELLAALVWTESRYCPASLSPKGAVGLGQLMPATATALGVNARDPGENLLGSARYLRAQYDLFGSWELALAAYNAGPGTVKRYGGVPPFRDTAYVTEVIRLYRRFSAKQPTDPEKES